MKFPSTIIAYATCPVPSPAGLRVLAICEWGGAGIDRGMSHHLK